jgi:hypothetical protein
MAFRREFLTLEGGKPLTDALEPWQLEHVLGPLDALDEKGLPLYRMLDFELHRGAGKTTIAGAEVVTELAVGGPYRRVYAFACDEGQARLLHAAAAGFIHRDERLRDLFVVERNGIRLKETQSFLEIMSADDASAYGLTPDLIVFDEIGKLKRAREGLWDAVFTSIVKKPHARIICISSPGWSRKQLAWRVREAARTTPGYYLYAPMQHVSGWQKDDPELARQRSSGLAPEHIYRREHLGVWTEGDGRFITAADLARCGRRPGYRTTCREGAHVLALDLGLVNDRTVAAIVHRDRVGDKVVLDDMRVWQGTRDNPVLISGVEDYMRDADRDFTNVRFVTDPWNMQATAQRFPDRVKVFEFGGQGKPRLTRNLYSLIRNGQLVLSSLDEDLDEELLDVQMIQKEAGPVIDHDAGGHDDRVIALGMAALEVMSEPPPSYASGSTEPDPYYDVPQAAAWRDIGDQRRRGLAAAMRQ